ncbi:MAG: aminodeoxychorismate synthase component I [Thermoanaerobaculia bacterium]
MRRAATRSGGIERALLRRAPGEDRFLSFSAPERALIAHEPDEVPALLLEVERAAAAGRWAVGFVAYEAAGAFDRALVTHEPLPGVPVAAFSIFAEAREVAAPAAERPARLSSIAPAVAADEHAAAVAAIRAAIARGETYQVNFTFPCAATYHGAPEDLFAALLAPGEAPYAAFLGADRWTIASLSPELFFSREHGRLTMRPMKGTRARGRFPAEDRALAAELAGAVKDRAENLMIVDMVRNDLARVAATGSVRVERPFAIERYPTLWQMTSGVTAASEATLSDLFAALFPCASVTGAPKVAAMEWIRRLEPAPRGVYCGAVGCVAPGGAARFSVGIRTLTLDHQAGTATYGVGSGIVWESEAGAEYRECLDKAAVLANPPAGGFELFETLLWRSCGAARWLEHHLARLVASADHWGFPCDAPAARRAVAERGAALPRAAHRLRLRLAPDGAFAVEVEEWTARPRIWTVALAHRRVDSGDRFLFHKTTRRAVYDAALAAAPPGIDEVLLVNERGELTEGTRTNLVLEIDGRRLTPRLEAGLLPGVARGRLLAAGRIAEATLAPSDLARATRVWLVSSLRGILPARRPQLPLESPA